MAKPFEASQESLATLTNMEMAYAIPLYQRRYVWGVEENTKLWDDVKDCYEKHCNHFLGSLVLMKYEKDPYDQKYQADELEDKSYSVYHVVDGQQRLTSLSLILAALYRDMLDHDAYYRELPSCTTDDSQDWDSLKTDIRNCLVTKVRDRNSKSGKGYIPRIIPVSAIYDLYKEIVNTGSHGKRSRIDKAFILHADKIRILRESVLPSTNLDLIDQAPDSASSVYNFYDDLFRAITQRTKIIRIECGADEDAFQVFESLNGTGLRLSASDRIKNMLMGRASHESTPMPISKVESEWAAIEKAANGPKGGSTHTESFFSAYMFVIAGERVASKDLTKKFVDKYLSGYEKSGIKMALRDLNHAAGLYSTIVHQTDYIDSDGNSKQLSPKLKVIMDGIQKNNPSQSVVPLLAAAHYLKDGFDNPQFETIAETLLVLLVRHKVCQLSTNMLDRFFGEFCKELAAMDNDDATEAIKTLRVNTKDDQSFYREFAAMSLDTRNRADVVRARYYLQHIENYLRMLAGNDELGNNEEYTLEHVIPQDYSSDVWFANQPEERAKFDETQSYRGIFDDTVIQSIGNMCLLRRPENSSASNAEFSVKLQRYQQPDKDGKTARGTFQLVNQIVNNAMKTETGVVKIVEDGETFGPKAVERRANALAEYALRIWKL